MRRIISFILCAILVCGCFAPVAFAAGEETTGLVLDIDVNKRYTDIEEDTDGLVTAGYKKDNENNKTVYVAVLVAALVISVIILVVSLKRVPNEDKIDMSGEEKSKKKRGKEE